MLVTNTTAQDYWFGPLHLLGGVGQTLTVDDTTATSLYLTDDAVADAINNLYSSGKITVSSQAQPFPRPTGVPSLLHGDGSPEGLVYAPQGSVYLRRDGTGANSLYTKTTGVTLNTGWESYTTTAVGPGTTYRKTTAKQVANSTTETDLLNGEIAIGASVLGTTGLARIFLQGDCLFNTGGSAAMPRFKLKLGATATVVLDTGANSASTKTASDTTRYAWSALVEIANLGATNSQFVTLDLILQGNFDNNGATTNTFATGSGRTQVRANPYLDFWAKGSNASSIDTTVAMAVAFTVTNATANASYDVTLKHALVEII